MTLKKINQIRKRNCEEPYHFSNNPACNGGEAISIQKFMHVTIYYKDQDVSACCNNGNVFIQTTDYFVADNAGCPVREAQ